MKKGSIVITYAELLGYAVKNIPRESFMYLMPLAKSPGVLAALVDREIANLEGEILKETANVRLDEPPEIWGQYVMRVAPALGELRLLQVRLKAKQTPMTAQLVLIMRFPAIAKAVHKTLSTMEMTAQMEGLWGMREEARRRVAETETW